MGDLTPGPVSAPLLTDILAAHVLHEDETCYALDGITPCPDAWTMPPDAWEDGGELAAHHAHVSRCLTVALAAAWNKGYLSGWDDRNEDEINPMFAGEQHDTPNPYAERGDL